MGSRTTNLTFVLGTVAATVLLQGVLTPCLAGEFRFLADGLVGYLDDGNYLQVAGADDEATGSGGAGVFLETTYDAKSLDLVAQYRGLFERQLDEPKLSSSTHLLNLRSDLAISRRSVLGASVNLSQTSQAYARQSPDPQPIVIVPRQDQFGGQARIDLSVELSRRMNLAAAAEFSEYRFEEDLYEDSRSYRASLGGAVHLTRDRDWFFLGGAQRDKYDLGDTDSLTVRTGLRWALGQKGREQRGRSVWSSRRSREVRMDVGGYTSEESGLESEQESYSGWLGGIQFAQRVGRTRWNLGARRDLSPSVGVGRTAELDSVFLGVSGDIGRRAVLGLYGTLSNQRTLADQEESEYRDLNANLDVVLMPWMGLTAGYSRFEQEGDLRRFEDLSFSRFYVYLSFRVIRSGARGEAMFESRPRRLGW